MCTHDHLHQVDTQTIDVSWLLWQQFVKVIFPFSHSFLFPFISLLSTLIPSLPFLISSLLLVITCSLFILSPSLPAHLPHLFFFWGHLSLIQLPFSSLVSFSSVLLTSRFLGLLASVLLVFLPAFSLFLLPSSSTLHISFSSTHPNVLILSYRLFSSPSLPTSLFSFTFSSLPVSFPPCSPHDCHPPLSTPYPIIFPLCSSSPPLSISAIT